VVTPTGAKHDVDAGFQDTSLDTSDGDGTNTGDFVNILQRKTQWFVGRTVRGFDFIKSFQQARTFVPFHVVRFGHHVVTFKSRSRDKWDFLGFETNLFQAGKQIGFDFFVTGFVPFDGFGIHFVDEDNHLFDAQSKGQQGVFTGLAIFGEGGFETTFVGRDDKNGDIGLGSTGDHVFDEISVSGGIDDSEIVFLGGKFPQSDVNGDTTFTFGLEFVKHPSVFKGRFTHGGGVFFKFFDGTFVDTTTFVDQVTSGGGFTGVDVSNDDQGDIFLFFTHVVVC